MSWRDEIDKDYDNMVTLRKEIKRLEKEYHTLAAANASNIVKAHNVFRMLHQVEQTVMKCPMCRNKRDEDGILAHHKKCQLADTLENANDLR